jgi:hypothetical protein
MPLRGIESSKTAAGINPLRSDPIKVRYAALSYSASSVVVSTGLFGSYSVEHAMAKS